MKKKLPIGIDNFEKIRENDYYYVDKTGMIKDLLMSGSEVTLFTRPRRFGKSLNMSMLKSFFSIDEEPEKQLEMFEKTQIAAEKELCETHMGKYPVLFLSLKEISALEYEKARAMMVFTVNELARENQCILQCEEMSDVDKEVYRRLLNKDMNDAVLINSLKLLSGFLKKYYESKTIILIDEYDVPLAKAFEQGYYNEMTELIRGFFGQALKSNDNLEFAVLTGCMRISKESIFTGLNNLRVCSVTDVNFEEFFGFTDSDVKKILEYYEFEEKYQQIKEWYDGYRFGNVEVYCPWDVLNYLASLQNDPSAFPQNYWMNTSSNEIVDQFIKRANNLTLRREVEWLINGREIEKDIHQELTHEDIYSCIENMWSTLFITGYLTGRETEYRGVYKIAIPNKEIAEYFETELRKYKESRRKNK